MSRDEKEYELCRNMDLEDGYTPESGHRAPTDELGHRSLSIRPSIEDTASGTSDNAPSNPIPLTALHLREFVSQF